MKKVILFFVCFYAYSQTFAFTELSCTYISKDKKGRPFTLILDIDKNRIYDAWAKYVLETDGSYYSAHHINNFKKPEIEFQQRAEFGIFLGSKPDFKIDRESLRFREGKDIANCEISKNPKIKI